MATTVTLRTPLKTPLGNVIAAAGVHDLVRPVEDGAATILTPEHYAGVTSASFYLRATDIVR